MGSVAAAGDVVTGREEEGFPWVFFPLKNRGAFPP